MVLSDGIEGRAAQEEVLHRFRALEAQLALQGVRSQGERVSLLSPWLRPKWEVPQASSR